MSSSENDSDIDDNTIPVPTDNNVRRLSRGYAVYRPDKVKNPVHGELPDSDPVENSAPNGDPKDSSEEHPLSNDETSRVETVDAANEINLLDDKEDKTVRDEQGGNASPINSFLYQNNNEKERWKTKNHPCTTSMPEKMAFQVKPNLPLSAAKSLSITGSGKLSRKQITFPRRENDKSGMPKNIKKGICFPI